MEKKSNDNMDEIILSRILKLMGIDSINMKDFANRLKYQKLIYLAQNMGINIGYGYSWYIRGPYAPLLTRTLFNIDESPDDPFDKWDTIKFKQEEEIVKRLQKLKKILGDNFDNPKYLEVLTSMHYLRKTLPQGENSYPKIEKRLLTIKPSLKKVPNIRQMIDNAQKDLAKIN